jgi:hypothetical protein
MRQANTYFVQAHEFPCQGRNRTVRIYFPSLIQKIIHSFDGVEYEDRGPKRTEEEDVSLADVNPVFLLQDENCNAYRILTSIWQTLPMVGKQVSRIDFLGRVDREDQEAYGAVYDG